LRPDSGRSGFRWFTSAVDGTAQRTTMNRYSRLEQTRGRQRSFTIGSDRAINDDGRTFRRNPRGDLDADS